MKPVDTEPDFLSLEREILAHWKAAGSFEELRRSFAGRPLFRFVDGPITANNPMGVHHAWGRTLKDVFLRYKVMTGHRVRYQNGFDCQGLWVEVEVEKALGFNGKPDIEAFGLDKFSRACRDRVNTYAAVISEQSARLGQWMDWDDSYYTHTDRNITGIWHFLERCHENGWLYRGHLPMPWCPRCGTSLSEHEMSSSYKEVEHLSVWVTAPLKDEPQRRLLLWTTTPWTLAANVAAAVNPELDYIEIKPEGADYTIIVGAKAQATVGKGEVVARFKGAELLGRSYETFFPSFAAQSGIEHKVVPWADVQADEGSGIVHIAPGCGREDFELGQTLGLPAVRPVDGQGVYGEGFGFLEGRVAMDVAHDVAEALREAGKLFVARPYRHSFPFCWRCKGELIFRLVDEWFISCQEVRPAMLAAAETVEWKPAYMGKRMKDWLTNMGDWCISRKRYWGLPLPFFCCDDCKHTTVVGSRASLRERAVDPAVVDALPELHRPWIDEVRIRCEKCGGAATRVPEVGDCWLDAGIVPYSTLGYFEDRESWEQTFPIEWICEMREQVRLWYYSMLFMGVAISGRAPYERVLSYERVIAEDGTTFSKTGYMIRFDEAVEHMGADAMRYLYCAQPVSSECRFGYELGSIAQRKLVALWNVYSFYVTYASIDRPNPLRDPSELPLDLTDRWLLARTAAMVERCTQGYEAWDTPLVLREVEAYVDDLSNWYVRVNRRRFWRSDDPADSQAAYVTLYTALERTIRVLAPITPFVTESIWQNLVRGQDPSAPASVHHARWPEPMDAWKDEGLLERTTLLRDVLRQALALREAARMRTRQPLTALHVHGPSRIVDTVREQEELVKRQLNVRDIAYPSATEAFETIVLGLDFGKAGPVLRKDVGRAKAALAELDAEAMAQAVAAQQASGPVHLPGFDEPLPAELFVRQRTPSPHFSVSEEHGRTLALDLRLNDELLAEGLMRDLVRQIQVWRKETDLAISDSIQVLLSSSSDTLLAAARRHRDTIAGEVLATRLELLEGSTESAPEGTRWLEAEIQGHPVTACIIR